MTILLAHVAQGILPVLQSDLFFLMDRPETETGTVHDTLLIS